MRALLLVLAFVACAAIAEDVSGVHDFDFLVGDWQVHHRRLKERLAGSTEWVEFDGTQSTRPALGGAGNVSENWFDMPGGAYRGVSVRSFDAKSGQWAIWWLDGRDPARALDPPLKGRFANAGTFYADDTFNGRPIRVRYIWSQSRRRRALGAGVLTGRRPDLGNELDQRFQTSNRRIVT